MTTPSDLGSTVKSSSEETCRNQSEGGIKRSFLAGLIRVLLLAFLSLIAFMSGFAVQGYMYISRDIPSIEKIKNYELPTVTEVFANNGELIAEFYKQRRFPVPMEEIPQILQDAFVVAEDTNFWKPRNLDVKKLFRLMLAYFNARELHYYGNTVYFCMAKKYRLTPRKKVIRAIQETILRHRIESELTKEDILYVYLNQIYLGSGSYGVEAAARTYFGKSVKDLTIAECAMIAGLPKAPTKYSPKRNLKAAIERRNYVLRKLLDSKKITREQFKKAKLEQAIIVKADDRIKRMAPDFAEHVRRYLWKKYGEKSVLERGLKVYTTVDLGLTEAAKKAIHRGRVELKKRQNDDNLARKPKVQAALMLRENRTGYVRVLIGRADSKGGFFNRATQAHRRPGSSSQTVIYTAALENGFNCTDMIFDAPITIIKPYNNEEWKPKNYKKGYSGPVSLRTAFMNSLNIPVIKIAGEIGLENAISYARKLGYTADFKTDLMLALSSTGVTLEEQVRAYSVFPNKGYLVPNVYINKVVDRHGKVLEENHPPAFANSSECMEESSIQNGSSSFFNVRPTVKPVALMEKTEQRICRSIKESTSNTMTSLLQDEVQKGEAAAIKKIIDRNDIAGKPGTTNDTVDAWFIGFSPGYTCGVWVGFDDHRPLGKGETGEKAAAPIWGYFMNEVLKGIPENAFDRSN